MSKGYLIKKLFFILPILLYLNTFVYAQNPEIFVAIFRGDLNYVQEFLANGGDVDTTGFRGMNLLHDSIFLDQTQIAMTLIEAGADINRPDTSGRTALYLALTRKNQTVVQALIERDAALDANSDWSKNFPPISLSEIVPSRCISDSYQTWIDANTHPDFLPYIEKYLSIKKEMTGQREFDYPVKILFYRSDSEVWRQVSRSVQKFDFQGAASTIFSNKHILINYDAWVTFSQTIRELTIFHELGHADLDRGHEPKGATSIMDPLQSSFLQDTDINEDPTLKQKLYKELFSKRGELGNQYIEGQIYPTTHISSDNPEICPVQTRLYLDETEASYGIF